MSESYENICNLCGVSDNENEIDYKPLSEKLKGDGISIKESIKNFTRIELCIDLDNKSSKICSVCTEKLQLIYDFTVACNLAQTTLRLYTKNTSSNPTNTQLDDDPIASDGLPETLFEEDSSRSQTPPNTENKLLECPICKKFFSSISNRNIHMQLHEQASFECGDCGKLFKSKLYLSKHIKFVHLVREVKCSVCMQSFQNRAKLDYHMRAHDPKRKFPCKYCAKSFMQPHHLQNHERIHTKEKPYLCPVCGKNFRQACNFKQHLNKHSTERDVYLTYLRQQTPKEMFKCDQCTREFNARTSLASHVRRAHSDQPGDKKVVGLRFHPYVCKVCNRGFKVPTSLLAHARVHSTTEDRKYHCEQCNSSFKRAEHLRIHINGIHLKQRPYACSFCPRTFSQSGDRNQHLKSHSSVKPFQCDFCQKQFKLQKALRTHLRIHTGERPYHCTFCKQTFMSYSALSNHTKKCELRSSSGATEAVVAPIEKKSNNFTVITLPLDSSQLQPLSTTVVITVPMKQRPKLPESHNQT